MSEDRQPRVFYGWYIVLAAFFIQVVAWGVHTTFGIFFAPWLEEFGWTRATLSGARSVSFLMMGFASIFVGRLGDRFGPRAVMAGCGCFLGLGFLLISQMNTLWQLYVFYGLLVGIGISGADVLLLPTVARWFVRKRGIVTGIIKSGTGLGMLVMPILANWLILEQGWPYASVVLGVMALVFIVAASLFLRRDPVQKGLLPYGEAEPETGKVYALVTSFSLEGATHTRQFWILCTIYFSILFCAQTIIVHIAPHVLDLGFSATESATVLAAIGGASMVGRIVMGGVGDRLGNRPATVICFVVYVVALLWLQVADKLGMLYLFSLVYGFAHGGFFAVISPLVAELFGLKSHGTIFGVIIFSGTVGGAGGVFLAGRIFDVIGSYQLAFLICAGLSIAALALASLLRRT